MHRDFFQWALILGKKCVSKCLLKERESKLLKFNEYIYIYIYDLQVFKKMQNVKFYPVSSYIHKDQWREIVKTDQF